MSEEKNEFDAELEEIRQRRMRSLLEKKETEAQKGLSWPQHPIEISDRNLNEIVKKYPVVIVDCWAPWCAPCHMVAPVIEALARDYQGRVVFGKLNVDEHQATPASYGIMSIPTLLVFKNGALAGQHVGAMPRRMLEPMITKYLSGEG
ncbi:MAG: thioredoxin [Candidatus Thermoplasmatota archaeon]